MLKFRRLSHQITAVFVGVILVILILSGLATSILVQRIVTNNVIRGQYDLAISLADNILFELGSNLKILEELARKSMIKSMVPASLVTELRAFQSRNPTITGLYIADNNGQQIARSDFDNTSNVAGTDGFQKALQGLVNFSDLSPVVLSSELLQGGNTKLTLEWQDSTVASVFVPILDGGKVTGVLGANVNLFRIQPLLENLTFTHDETVIIFSRSGKVVAHSHKSKLGKLPESIPPQLLTALEQGLLSVPENYKDEMGRTVKSVIYPIGQQGWKVVVQTPVSKLAEEVSGLWLLMSLVVVGGTALTVTAGWLIAGRLTRPIGELARAADKVAMGELNTKVETDALDEVGMLANSFNRMVSELSYIRSRNQQLLGELKQLNENLEQRIEQRTEKPRIAGDKADTANKAKSE